jgi:FkbM family methyltransferase
MDGWFNDQDWRDHTGNLKPRARFQVASGQLGSHRYTDAVRVQQRAIRIVAAITRRIHPHGTGSVLRLLYKPKTRLWSVRSIIRRSDGTRLLVDTASFIEWEVFFLGDYEPETLSVLRSMIRPGQLAIDVGANIGTHTLGMACAAESVRVIAFEPNPRIFARLRANLALNPDCHVDARQIAISDHLGEIELFLPPDTATNQGQASQAGDPLYRPIRVPCTTLDILFASENLSQLAVIKIDVEGFEATVLEGARELLLRHHPTLVFEFDRRQWARAGQEFGVVHQRLLELGYNEFAMASRHGLKPVPATMPWLVNIIARKN